MRNINIDDSARTGLSISFAMQPIVGAPTMRPYGYELLYRGPRPVHWSLVDKVLLNYLSQRPERGPTLFINLSNETVLKEDLTRYVSVAQRANTYFELTEAITEEHAYRDVAQRINAFSAQGLKFAIDDFGSGLDGLHRHAALAEVAFIKLDRLFMRQAQANPTTQRIVELLVDEWHASNTSTIAEGIETRADLEFAMRLGIQMFQGYYIDALHSNSAPTTAPIPA